MKWGENCASIKRIRHPHIRIGHHFSRFKMVRTLYCTGFGNGFLLSVSCNVIENRVENIKIWRVATCTLDKPGLNSFSETLALFFIQFFSFRKMKVQARQNGPSKSFRAYQKTRLKIVSQNKNYENVFL